MLNLKIAKLNDSNVMFTFVARLLHVYKLMHKTAKH